MIIPSIEEQKRSLQITTIIPTFQRPEKLRCAIESVLSQSYPHFWLHVYDNCSGDETEEVVKSFRDNRIRYTCRPHNIGYVENFRRALLEVQTPYFSFLCDDDILAPTFYEELLAQFQNNSQVGFVACLFSEKKNNSPLIFHKRPIGFFPAGSTFPDGIYFCGVLFSSIVLNKTHGISSQASYFIDLDYITRCLVHFPVVVIEKYLVQRCSECGNISETMKDGVEILVEVESKLLSYISREASTCLLFYQRHYLHRRVSSFWKMLVRKKYKEAELYLNQISMIISPKRIWFYKIQILLCKRLSLWRNFLKLYHKKLRYQEEHI